MLCNSYLWKLISGNIKLHYYKCLNYNASTTEHKAPQNYLFNHAAAFKLQRTSCAPSTTTTAYFYDIRQKHATSNSLQVIQYFVSCNNKTNKSTLT